MVSPYRTYITESDLEACRSGLFSVLGSEERADIVRLATRLSGRRPVLLALVGVPGQLGGRLFELAFRHTGKVLPATWEGYGVELGRAVEPWLRPDVQEPLQLAAQQQNKSVWDTHELEDLAQDAVDYWEDQWRSHLGGKLHVKAKEALVREFASAMMKQLRKKASENAAKARAAKKAKGNGDS